MSKKWLLHTANRPTLENTRLLAGTESNGILESRARHLLIANGQGRLRVDTIYPERSITRFIGGTDYQYYVETDGDDTELSGKNMIEGVNRQPWFEEALWRVEIQPETASLEDHFLTVLTPSLNDFRDPASAPPEN
ncbi:hypothetical protein [Sedimenticola hydrogenitrophicus]|uniref:hypothetical protein n=1 Tax=Sedimenticola hydrogenitrophicus TaxID=2967975 RepID=UPI0021A68AED|nr:hypothetical protein [Sedimenticola hydrogenitrophicus]